MIERLDDGARTDPSLAFAQFSDLSFGLASGGVPAPRAESCVDDYDARLRFSLDPTRVLQAW